MAVRIQSIKKCGFLRAIVRQAIASASTLKDTLAAAADGMFVNTSFAKGKLMVSNSGGGQSGSFEISLPDKEWTQENVFALIEELTQMTDTRIAAGSTDDGQPASTNALLAALIQDINAGLFPQSGVRTQIGDFSGLNFPATQLGAGPTGM